MNRLMTLEQVEDHNKRVREGKPKATRAGPGERPGDQLNAALLPSDKPKPEYEKWLYNQLLAEGVLGMELEYLWARGRKYRADIAFPDPSIRLIVEINGAAHRIKGRFHDDIRKAQEAVLQSWTLLPVSTSQVKDGQACKLVRRVLAMLMAKGIPF